MIATNTRQIILDTETTGMNKLGLPYEGHRIIEIGAVEIINRRLTNRHYHVYVKPDCSIDLEAYRIHGISDEFLLDKPTFDKIADEFLDFIRGSELIIHNAIFDIGFIDNEFRLLSQGIPKIETICSITDSLVIARRLFPGKRNNLDALCHRYKIDNSKRTLHGALLDAELLAKVYLAMTGGQASIAFLMQDTRQQHAGPQNIQRIPPSSISKRVIYASDLELEAHEIYLNLLEKTAGLCLWRSLLLRQEAPV